MSMDQIRSIRTAQLVILAAVLGFLSSCGPPSPPSTTECIARWNRSGNRDAQAAVAALELPRADVRGWPSKAGDHCSATFFTRPGSPWVMYVLWIDAPEPRIGFARDIGGLGYGRGELGAETPAPSNAEVRPDGRLIQQ
jgi:hypothetical protein